MKRRAFTLIELLVVISIIGLLSTIAVVATNASRAEARDAKRIADLKQISTAVELYIDANNITPRGGASWCTYISNASNGWGAAFQADLAPYLAHTPLDPTKHNQVGDYLFDNDNVFQRGTQYILCANLERSTGNSYDKTNCAGGVVYNYCIYPNGK